MTPAHYFDGRNGRLHPARLTVAAGRLLIIAHDVERSVPLDAVQVAEPFARASLMLRLDGGGTCEIPAGPEGQHLLDALGYRKGRVARWQERWPAALLALGMLALLLGLAYLRGVPLAAASIAARLPASLDAELGRVELAGMEAGHLIAPTHLDDALVAGVEALLARIRPAQSRMPLRLLVRAASGTDDEKDLGANALALPDGTIVVTDELVRLVLNQDGKLDDEGRAQLLGVIGHEVGHIERRHAVRTLMSSSLASVLSVTMFGDFSATAAALPAMLTNLQYSREMELEADDDALAVLRRNGVAPAHFANVLRALERQHPGLDRIPRWLSHSLGYLSTHPDTAERIERLSAASRH